MRVLIIEDDQDMAAALKDMMKQHYAVDLAYTGEKGLNRLRTSEYDLILLDLILPDVDGIEVCKQIRDQNITTPILVLSGQLATEEKIKALDAGADDYLVKPYSSGELLARMRALFRRQTETLIPETLTTDGLTMNVTCHKVFRGEEEIHLRRKEFDILEYLLRNKGRVLTREMILNHVWNNDNEPFNNAIDVHIKYLRDKVDKPYGTTTVKTVHGYGYKIEE